MRRWLGIRISGEPRGIRMSPKSITTLDVRTRAACRRWLERHHDSEAEIWLVFHKKHTDVASIDTEDAIEEALRISKISGVRSTGTGKTHDRDVAVGVLS